MINCIIGNIKITNSLIRVNSSAFGKSIASIDAIPYLIEIDFDTVLSYFNEYYQDFIKREKDEDEDESFVRDYFLSLRETGYLNLEKMLMEQPKLLSIVLKKELSAEFLGYIFLDTLSLVESKKFILQTLTELQIIEGKVICKGQAFLNRKFI